MPIPLGLVLASGLAASVPGAASAPELVILKSTDPPAWRQVVAAVRRTAAAHHVVEHDLRGDRGQARRVLSQVKEQGRPVVLVALGSLAAQTAREVAPTLPLVFCLVHDPEGLRLLDGSNTTGVAFNMPVKIQWAALRGLSPQGTRVGVVYNPDNVGRQVEEAERAAALLHLSVVARPISSASELPGALRSLLKGRDAVDVVWLPPDPMLLADEARRHILSEALRAEKPVLSFTASLVAEGALASHEPDLDSVGEQAGDLANRLAAGEHGASIRPVMPRAQLVINRRTADRLKVAIPSETLKKAKLL